ncbi:MAG: NIF family HAD-type phosphatase [Candidatus Micrarchaeaceae archaeon]
MESYAAGVRNPSQLAESFGLGYAGGMALQGSSEAIGSAIGSLSTLARQALAKAGILRPVEVTTELSDQAGVNAMVRELPDNPNLLYNMIDKSIGRFGIDTTPFKSLGAEDLKNIIALNPQFFLDSRAIAETEIPISVLQKDLQQGAISQDKIATILRMMNVDTKGLDAAAQKELLMNKLANGEVPRFLLTKGYTLGNTFDFLPSDIRNNLENAARNNPTGDNIVHLTSKPDIIKGDTVSIDFAEHPTQARAAFASGLSKYSSAPGAETTALGYGQYANPFAEESSGSISGGEFRGNRFFGQIEPFNYYPTDWLERIQFARQYDPNIIPELARTYSPSGIPDELRNFDWFYTTQASHDRLHIQTPVPEYMGSGELETGTPATGNEMQKNKFDIIVVRPNQGLFADTPLAKLFPTYVRGTLRSSYLMPSSWDEIARAIKNSKNPQIAQEFETIDTSDLAKSLETKTPVPRQVGRGILTDPSGDYIYLVHEVGRPYFSLSGGGIKVGEDPLAATIREISEELNVKPEVINTDPVVSNYLGEKKTFFTSGAPFRDNTDAWKMVIKKDPEPDMKEIDYVLKVPKEDLSKIKLDADSRYILKQAIPDMPDYTGVSMPQNIKKVVFDLDGTLIDQYGNLRPGARELLDSLREQGKQVALWTHSPYDRTAQILKSTHLDDYFDIKDPNQVVTREDYATDNNVHAFKDIKRIGGDILIDDDPIQIKQQIAAGNYAIPTTKYYGGDSHDLLRIKDMLLTPAERPTEPLTPDTYKEVSAPDLSDIDELHNAGIINDKTYSTLKSLQETNNPNAFQNLKTTIGNKINNLASKYLPTDYEKAMANGEIDANGNLIFKYDSLSADEKALYNTRAEERNILNKYYNEKFGTSLPTDISGKEYYDALLNRYDPRDIFDSKGTIKSKVSAYYSEQERLANYNAFENERVSALKELESLRQKIANDPTYANEVNRISAEEAKIISEKNPYTNVIPQQSTDVPEAEDISTPSSASSSAYSAPAAPADISPAISILPSQSPSASLSYPSPSPSTSVIASPSAISSPSSNLSLSPSASIPSGSPVSSINSYISPSVSLYPSSSFTSPSASPSPSIQYNSLPETDTSPSVQYNSLPGSDTYPTSSTSLYSPDRKLINNPSVSPANMPYIEFKSTPIEEYTIAQPTYAASVSSVLFPSLNAVASESYNPLLAGALLRPIATAENPTVAQPLAQQSPTTVREEATNLIKTSQMPITPTQTTATSQAIAAPTTSTAPTQATASVQPLDMPTIGPETPTELALAQAINENQANLALSSRNPESTNSLYAKELNTALQKTEAQDIQAREAENFQNNLYMRSIYDSLVNSGLPPSMIEAMLRNAYNQVAANTAAQMAPAAAVEPYAQMTDIRRYNQNPNMPIASALMPLQAAMASPLRMQAPAAQRSQAASLPNFQARNQAPAAQLQNTPLIPNIAAASLPRVSLAYINPSSFVEANPYAELPPALMRLPA